MNKFYFLIIPAIIGIATGGFLASSFNNESDTTELTAKNLIENGSPIYGNQFAEITILEFGDYQCTFCYKFHQSSLKAIQSEYIDSGKVKLVFKDFPLNGPDSILAAMASYCANEQGKYWEYHDELYINWGGERTGWVTRDSLEQFANTVGLDVKRFNSCLDEDKYRDKVIEQYDFGQRIGIDATPSFLIFNDEKVVKVRGNQPLDVFKRVLDDF